VATWDDVRRIALALPETSEKAGGHDGTASWQVRAKTFVWERPLRRSDIDALGSSAPTGPVLGVRVADLEEKEALVAAGDAVFTTPHFHGYAAVLVELDRIDVAELGELITDAWLSRAPKRLAAAYLEDLRG
jgi:hypothetical protein